MTRLQHGASRRRSLTALLVAGLSGGCSFAPQRYAHTEVRADSLQPGLLARDGIAFLTPSTVTGQEEDRQTLALLFTQGLAGMRPELRIVALPEVLTAVNRHGLTDLYRTMFADYAITGVFRRDGLAQLATATKTRFVAQLKLARFEQGARSRLGLLGLSLLQTQFAHMRVFFQVWDCQDGAVVWEGIDEITLSVETSRERAVTLRALALEAARDFAARLP